MKKLEFVSIKYFNKVINNLLINKNVFKINIIINNLILYSIILNINIFNSFIMLRILYKGDNALIIIEDNNCLK